MSARLITEKEILDARKIPTLAFLGTSTFEELKPEMHERYKTRVAGSFDEEGRLNAVATNLALNMMLDGRAVPCGGIASVASRAEMRGRGNVREILTYWLRDMLANHWPLTYLYPFSYEFYRKFGYELCCQETRVKDAGLEMIVPFKQSLRVVMYEPGMPKETEFSLGIRACYERFVAGQNVALKRADAHWEKLFLNPYESRAYLYAALDSAGNICGYAAVKLQPHEFLSSHEFMKHAVLYELAYENRAALESLLAVIRSLGAQISKINIILPPGVLPEAILSPYRDVRLDIASVGMGRVVDVPAALHGLRAGTDSGSLTIRPVDGILPENDRTFRVKWTDARVCDVQETGDAPDLTAPIGRLTQLVFGFRSARDLAMCADVVMTDIARAQQLFPGKTTMMWDHF